MALPYGKIEAIIHYFCGHKLIQLAGSMQSNQFKSDSVGSNLNLNPSFLENNSFQAKVSSGTLNLLDSTVLDSLNANYIAPDSIIYLGLKPEWTQFKSAHVPEFNYQRDLIQPLPYDSLQTVLKGVEVVFQGKKLLRNNPDWLVGVLIFCFILFATIRLIFNKYLSQLVQSATNYSTFSRLFREKYFNLFHASFRLDIISNLVFALFVYQFLYTYRINFGLKQSLSIYLVCLGGVVGYFTVKRIAYWLIGLLTECRPEVQEYLFNITVYNRILGLFLLPVTATVAFVALNQVEPILYFGLFLVAVFYLLSLIRGGKIFLKKHFSISYLILYLCTLEFLPLILIYNLLII